MAYRLTENSPETSVFEIKPESLPCPLWQTSPKASIPARIPNLFKSFIKRLGPHRNSLVISIAQDEGYISESVCRVLRRSKEGKEYDVPVYRLPPHP